MRYFTISEPSFHDPTMHDSCKHYPKILKLCGENYVNICPRNHMESDSDFIDWLIFIYLWNIMLHCLAILHLQAIINRNYNLRKHSPRGVLWKTFFKNLWKLTGKHLSWSMFIIKTAGWRPVTFMAQFSLQYSFLRSGMALGPEIPICMHKCL